MRPFKTLPFVSRFLFVGTVFSVHMYLCSIAKVKEDASYPCMLFLIIVGNKSCVEIIVSVIFADWLLFQTILLYADTYFQKLILFNIHNILFCAPYPLSRLMLLQSVAGYHSTSIKCARIWKYDARHCDGISVMNMLRDRFSLTHTEEYVFSGMNLRKFLQ